MITDTDLIRAAYPGTQSAQRFAVTYFDGTKVFFAVSTLKEARQYAREYGVRFLSGARVAGIETQ